MSWPHTPMDFFQSRVSYNPKLALFAFQLWRVAHAPFVKTSIVCSPIKIRTSIPIYLAVTLWYSEDVGNSELVKSQTAPRIPVYGSKV